MTTDKFSFIDEQECFACRTLKKVNKNGICSVCKTEVRAIGDCWLVQEFRRRYSEEETQEAVEQLEVALIKNFEKLMLEVLEGLEVDVEATEMHIRKVMKGKPLEEIDHQVMLAQLDADDRKAVLDDVREALESMLSKSIQEQEEEN